LASLLEKIGCSSQVLLTQPLLPTFGQANGAGPRFEREVQLVRTDAPGAKRIFESTPVVHPDEWQPLQARRIRYFKKPTKTEEE
jgi:hypothetical protein